MRPVIALVLLGACGRIGFDALGGGGGGGGGDGGGDSHVADTPTDAPADAASLCTPFDRTYAAGNVGVSGLAWMGSRYAIMTVDGLATISETGTLGTFTQLSPAPATLGAGQNAIAWGMNELAVVWTSAGGQINIQMFDDLLAPATLARQVAASGGDQAHVIAGDTAFAVVWHQTSGEFSIEEVEASGGLNAGPYATSSSGQIAAAQTVTSISGFYLVGFYQGGGVPGLLGFDRPLDGNGSAPTIAIGTSQVDYLQLASLPSGAVVLQAAGTGAGTGYAQLLGAAGMATSGMIALPTDGGNVMNFATVVNNGTHATMVGITGSAPAQIVLAQLDPGSAAFGPVQEVATQVVSAYGPVAAVHAPGRLLLAIPYSDGGGANSHTRVIQICL